MNEVNAPSRPASAASRSARRAAAPRRLHEPDPGDRGRASPREVTVAGTTIGADHRPRLVHALGYEIEIELEPLMVFVINSDQPGMIGRVGTLLGEARGEHRHDGGLPQRAGGNALMALTVDTPLPAELVRALCSQSRASWTCG